VTRRCAVAPVRRHRQQRRRHLRRLLRTRRVDRGHARCGRDAEAERGGSTSGFTTRTPLKDLELFSELDPDSPSVGVFYGNRPLFQARYGDNVDNGRIAKSERAEDATKEMLAARNMGKALFGTSKGAFAREDGVIQVPRPVDLEGTRLAYVVDDPVLRTWALMFFIQQALAYIDGIKHDELVEGEKREGVPPWVYDAIASAASLLDQDSKEAWTYSRPSIVEAVGTLDKWSDQEAKTIIIKLRRHARRLDAEGGVSSQERREDVLHRSQTGKQRAGGAAGGTLGEWDSDVPFLTDTLPSDTDFEVQI